MKVTEFLHELQVAKSESKNRETTCYKSVIFSIFCVTIGCSAKMIFDGVYASRDITGITPTLIFPVFAIFGGVATLGLTTFSLKLISSSLNKIDEVVDELKEVKQQAHKINTYTLLTFAFIALIVSSPFVIGEIAAASILAQAVLFTACGIMGYVFARDVLSPLVFKIIQAVKGELF